MTVFLRALYGPFGREYTEHRCEVDWHFFGIREDNTMGRWTIRFDLKSRMWKAFAAPISVELRVAGAWRKAGDIVHPDAFVPDTPMVYGRTYLEILKPRLSAEDIAFASRLAIEAAR